MPPEYSDLIWEHTRNGAHTPEVLSKVMEAYNNTLKRVCWETGVPYIDLASMLPRDTTVFYDDCHLNISGCDKIADILTKNLLPDKRRIHYESAGLTGQDTREDGLNR